MKPKKIYEINKKLNQLIEQRALWCKDERKGKRSDYMFYFTLTGCIEALEWNLGKRDGLYDKV